MDGRENCNFNQEEMIKSKKGELQFGGVIYSDSAD